MQSQVLNETKVRRGGECRQAISVAASVVKGPIKRRNCRGIDSAAAGCAGAAEPAALADSSDYHATLLKLKHANFRLQTAGKHYTNYHRLSTAALQ
jgi:hypothetical protein